METRESLRVCKTKLLLFQLYTDQTSFETNYILQDYDLSHKDVYPTNIIRRILRPTEDMTVEEKIKVHKILNDKRLVIVLFVRLNLTNTPLQQARMTADGLYAIKKKYAIPEDTLVIVITVPQRNTVIPHQFWLSHKEFFAYYNYREESREYKMLELISSIYTITSHEIFLVSQQIFKKAKTWQLIDMIETLWIEYLMEFAYLSQEGDMEISKIIILSQRNL